MDYEESLMIKIAWYYYFENMINHRAELFADVAQSIITM